MPFNFMENSLIDDDGKFMNLRQTIEDAIKILQNIFPDLKVSISNDMGFYPKRGTLDIKKSMDIGGYIPKYSLEKGLQKYIDFMRS